ncbi:hypothetical protein ACLOJK_030632 [Asimina triloba]
MCNQEIGCLRFSSLFEPSVDQTQVLFSMDGSAASIPMTMTTTSPTDDTPRVKFLCSFGGSILPRPLDGKLRYVGGETRIVCVPRDATFPELMSRMRELFEGAALLKYQQPDEDLDALVSVVNDDDVMNMMEEYDKVDATGDGFTRLRIFLFSHPDHDVSPHFDGDERETERRYVDALNSLSDAASDVRKQPADGPFPGQLDKIHSSDQFYNPMNNEIQLPQFNLHHINVPPPSGQHAQQHSQRFNDMEAPWSPGYYSSGHPTPHDPRSEYPSSPSASRYWMPFGDLSDKCVDRISEEFGRHPLNHLPSYDRQPSFADNVVWLPPGPIAGDKSGFPGNSSHSHNAFEGNIICEHCKMTFQKNQPFVDTRYPPDARWRHGQPHMEQPSPGNEFIQFSNRCGECFSNRETYLLNPETKLEHGFYSNEQGEHHPFYNESHNHDRGWVLHHQLNRAEEPRMHLSGASGRINDQFTVDGTVMNMNLSFIHDGHAVPSNCINHDDARYMCSPTEPGNEPFHDQTAGAAPGHHMQIQQMEECGKRFGNLSPGYGMDGYYQGSHGSVQMHALRRQVQNPICGGPSHDTSAVLPQANGNVNAGFVRSAKEGSPTFSPAGMEDRNPRAGNCVDPSQKVFGFEGSAAPAYLHDHTTKLNPNILFQENQQPFASEAITLQPEMVDFTPPAVPVLRVPSSSTLVFERISSSTTSGHQHSPGSPADVTTTVKLEENTIVEDAHAVKQAEIMKESDVQNIPSNKIQDGDFYSNDIRPIEDGSDMTKVSNSDAHGVLDHSRLSVQYFSFLPELIASVKKAAIEGAEEVKAIAQGNGDDGVLSSLERKDPYLLESEPVNNNVEVEHDSDNDHPNDAKIEPTKAEEEALDRGLQTIRNDDLEEVRELGSGTYGSVYHGKWKGSDVAIKRIKASCFAGRPSERERLHLALVRRVPHFPLRPGAKSPLHLKELCQRLQMIAENNIYARDDPVRATAQIADFWKEALILSSLHHPNVVSFYGIVRDGPDGSLATVTEFMVNGSLKQFLQKKDRTIDRRKRLIIAMDVSFGMEYLHGKNIVHFDLKCENLLVNMRDPHRPICKENDACVISTYPILNFIQIGDLGLSKVKHHTLVSGGVRGTLPWMAPELLSGKSNMVSEKIDVYSFGIAMWELLTGEEPYADMHCASIIGGIVNNSLRPQVPSWCDPEWKSLMESCWSSDPKERPAFSQISQTLRKMAAAVNVK